MARSRQWQVWTLGVAYSSLLLLLALRVRFAILSNDTFPLAFQARHLSFHRPESFYNGFFPIGYPMLMRLSAILGDTGMSQSIVALQILLAGCFAVLVWKFASRHLDPAIASLATTGALFMPDFIRYELSATPDFLCAALMLAAMSQFTSNDNQRALRTGILLGIAALFRTHSLVLLLALLLTMVAVGDSTRFKAIRQLITGAVPFILLQGLLQLYSGHGFFETMQNFNIAKMMHGIDWARPRPVAEGSLQLILRDPALFLSRYFDALRNVAIFLAILLVAAFVRLRSGKRDELTPLFFAASLYLCIVTVGASARGILPMLALSFVALGSIVSAIPWLGLFLRHRTPARLLFLASLVFSVIASLLAIQGTNPSRMRIDEYAEIAKLIEPKRIEDIAKIYSDDFALYFTDFDNATPLTLGGWAPIGIPSYRRVVPTLDDQSAESFYRSLCMLRMKYVILRQPVLDPRVAGFVLADSAHYLPLKSFRAHTIYVIR